MSLQFDVDAENFQLYRQNKRSPEVALGALILRLVNILGSGGGTGSGGSGATATNQAATIAELQALVSKVSTKADQDEQDALLGQIQTTTEQLKNDWLAENATEQKQNDIIDLLKELVNYFGSTFNWTVPAVGSVDDQEATDILLSDPTRKALRLCIPNDTPNIIFINIDADASVSNALYVVQKYQTLILEGEAKGRISAIASAGTINYTLRVAT